MSEGSDAADMHVRYSIITAAYNVERYLGDFIQSIEFQIGIAAGAIEVIAIDDGSTDRTRTVLEAWAERRPDLVTVLTKSNGGQSSARNLGLANARGEWVTFIDPDDAIAPDYFSRVERMISRRAETQMVATPRIMWAEATNRRTKTHPTQWMFSSDQYVNLNRYPDFFHGSAATAFFRRAQIVVADLRFDERVKPNFEDGQFIVRYLLSVDEPLVAFAGSAHYYYRRRADGSSAVQTSSAQPGYYSDVPRWGYLECLRMARARYGFVPEWIQSLILYELSWYFRLDEAMSGVSGRLLGSGGVEFRGLIKEIAMHLDPAHILSISHPRYTGPWREYLVHAVRGEDWHTPYVVLTKYDERSAQVRLSFRYAGRAPREEVLLRGQVIEPVHAKRRAIEYFGETLLWERIIWVSARGTLRVRLDGVPVELKHSYPAHPGTTLRPRQIRTWFDAPQGVVKKNRTPRRPFWVRCSENRLVGRILGRPWVLVDRLHNAGDSAEIVYRHLREKRRDINAWFVIDRKSRDFRRLRKAGFWRLVSPGSLMWKILMARAEVLISSHADIPITDHPAIVEHVRPQHKFVFLQHGVIKDDLSSWLNRKEIDVFITSTSAEYRSIVADGTRYLYTSKEVRLTGLPRFDALLRADASVDESEKNLVLIAPTWRHWLVPPTASGTQRRELTADFLGSEFCRRWTGLIRDDRIRDAAAERGMTLAFLPHPNLQAMLRQLRLPEHVVPLTFERVQETFARTRILVTDYSSMAFNTAYLDRATVYYQFDSVRFNSGGHVGRRGYFEYAAHGFGPVVEDHEQAVERIIAAIHSGGVPEAEYQARIDETFPRRDGAATERVVSAIESMLQGR